jgi:hypothetical protein
MTRIDVGVAFPPHREERVAEFQVVRGDVVDIPAELYRSSGQLMIALYSKSDGIAWEYRVSDFLSAIASGIDILEN